MSKIDAKNYHKVISLIIEKATQKRNGAKKHKILECSKKLYDVEKNEESEVMTTSE